MASIINVITGATGILGSHIAQQLAARGEKVRALVRPTSDLRFLTSLGAESVVGDLADEAALAQLCRGADTLYHCAARVGDFGKWNQFRTEIVEGTARVMKACRAANVARALHVSSVAVYGHRPRIPPDGLTESSFIPHGRRFGDNYGRAKAEAEAVARATFPEVTIIRPTWTYGPRDRHGFPRLLQALRGSWVSIVGTGDNLLNILHAEDLARGAILAATKSEAAGQTYNMCSEGDITQRQFLDALCDALGLPQITRRYPVRLAYFGGWLGEVIARIIRLKRAPHISRYTVSRLARSTAYRIGKAKSELGWSPRIKTLDGVRDALQWYQQSGS
jgi:nucleoside-diphosphate-sugar epimerase